ncbi:hypothetical protein D9M69_575140 [compost metagenome]
MQDAVHVVDAGAVAQAAAPAHRRQDERTAAHALGAGADGDVGIAEEDALRGGDDRLQAGAAQAVDVERRGFLRDAGVHRGDAAEVGVARFGGNHVAHHHMADLGRGDARALDGGLAGSGSQGCHGNVLQGAAEGTDCGARGTYHEDLTLCHVAVR